MNDSKSQEDAKTDRVLPQARIRTIMKSSAGPLSLSIKDESLQIVCRATEMFIQMLAKESHKCCEKDSKSVDYKHLAQFVQGEDRLEFLHQIVPTKITVKEFREIMAKQKKHSNSSDETTSSEDDEDDDEGDDDIETGAKNKSNSSKGENDGKNKNKKK